MYLDFIIDFVREGDYISIECGESKYSGSIVKITPDLIAIRTGQTIIVKKDSEITNPPIIGSSVDSNNDQAVLETKENVVDAEVIDTHKENGVGHETAATIEPQNSPIIDSNISPKLPGVKIVGKIDLDAIPKSTRKKKSDSTTDSSHEEENIDDAAMQSAKELASKQNLAIPYITMGEYNPEWDNIDRKELKLQMNIAKQFTTKEEKEKIIEANAKVSEVKKKMFKIIVSFSDKPLPVLKRTIVEHKLFEEISSHQLGDIHQIVTLQNKDDAQKIILSISSDSIAYYLDLLEATIREEHFQQTKLICYFLLNHIESPNARKALMRMLAALRPVNAFTSESPRRENSESTDGIHSDPSDLRVTERTLTTMIAKGDFEGVIEYVDKLLLVQEIPQKYRSSLMLRKAQAYSSLQNAEKAEEAYVELIEYLQHHNGAPKNLSHLYTELARLQSAHSIEDAISSVGKALRYNSGNKFAANLLAQLQSVAEREDDGTLIVDEEHTVGLDSISKMINIDISEYEFSSPRVLNNNGVVTPDIADELYELAQLEDKYPAYIEAAKAYHELNIGSYDTNNYISSVSNYARLKGDYLFSKFKLLSTEKRNNRDSLLIDLCRLKDSACSYYIESLNLYTDISADTLLGILGNYLIMEVAYHVISTNGLGLSKLFNSTFAEVFAECIGSKDRELERIVYSTVVSIGSASIFIWNKLNNIPGGTKRLYAAFASPERTVHIFQLINENEHSIIDVSKKPGEFLKESFEHRQETNLSLQKWANSVISFGLNLHQIEQVEALWNKIADYEYLFLPTDIETKVKIDNIIGILLPYLSRTPDERTTLILQAQKLITTQLKFINENTTYYGRTIFYPLLQKWAEDIENLFEEKIAKAQPILKVELDPPYHVEDEGKNYLNLIITNTGSSTAEGFELNMSFDNAIVESLQYKSSQEIPTNGRTMAKIEIKSKEGAELVDSIDVIVNASAIFQGKVLEAQIYNFTVEKEPESTLELEDIKWQDGPVVEGILFKGRQSILQELVYHYKSIERDKSYILYGLTRTGKSSILTQLGKDIKGTKIRLEGKDFVVCTFFWELNEAADLKKATDFWEYLLRSQIFDAACKDGIDFDNSDFPTQPRAKDFKILLTMLHQKGYYPLILVDEFSYIKMLMDDGIINAAFLAAIRQYALNGLSSFIFAGTYDVKDLIRDPKYGITGQLVNSIEMQINEIPKQDAEDLINVMGDKLIFSADAIAHIHKLSGDVPFFIQIICKNCGFYAVEHKRRTIGYPDLENVIRVLTGESRDYSFQNIKCLPENRFQNNQYSASDPPEVKALISSITYIGQTKSAYARPVGFAELQKLWAEKKVGAFRPKLATALSLLLEKKILVQSEDDGLPVYEFSVDIFRRWWMVHHSDIDLELTTIE